MNVLYSPMIFSLFFLHAVDSTPLHALSILYYISVSAKMPEKIRQTMKSNIPMKKFGTTDNVSDLIMFLASERSAYITGEAVEISGAISF
jgi:NAD(P)-dependent dehydrogenase (short-subunit alcohol dehydrogenase family)